MADSRPGRIAGEMLIDILCAVNSNKDLVVYRVHWTKYILFIEFTEADTLKIGHVFGPAVSCRARCPVIV